MSFWSSLTSLFGGIDAKALPAADEGAGVGAELAHAYRSPSPLAEDVKLPTTPMLNGGVIGEMPLYRQVGRIGGSMTPQQVSIILREADIGRTKRLMDLGNASKQKDGHLQSILEQSEQSIAGMKWQLVIDEDEVSKRKEKQLKELDTALRNTPSFTRMLAHHAGSFFYSYSVTETYWAKDGGLLLPRHFETLPHRRFEFRQSDGRLTWADDGMIPVDFREENPGQFVVSQPRINGDVPHREGLIRVLIWAALFRNWTLTDWLRLGEAAWKPYAIATYDRSAHATQDDVDKLIEMMSKLYTSGRVAMPNTCDLEVSFPGSPGSGTPTHQSLFETMAREMSKVVLGQTETVQASASSGYAQASVHDDIRRELRNARAVQIAADITRDVVWPLVLWNYGASFPRVRFEFITQEPKDIVSFSTGVKNLVTTGVKVGQKWVRDEAGIPDPQDGEELCEVATPGATPADGTDPNATDPKAGGKEDPNAAPAPKKAA